MKDPRNNVNQLTDWKEDFKKKLVSFEEAVGIIRSEDHVVIPPPEQPIYLVEALAARANELKNIHLSVCSPLTDPGWLSPGMEASFIVDAEMSIGATARSAADEKLISYNPYLFSSRFKEFIEADLRAIHPKIDVFLVPVSPPDEEGFCSFGHTLWNKRSFAARAHRVVAEINPKFIRTPGHNRIHVSEIDYFCEQPPEPDVSTEEWGILEQMFHWMSRSDLEKHFQLVPGRYLKEFLEIGNTMGYREAGDFLMRPLRLDPPSDVARGIAGHLKDLIHDGDTIQIGIGRPGSFMVELGVFDDKNDLGIHTEMGCPGMALLVKKGIANGRYYPLHPGKAVFSSFSGCHAHDLAYVHENPLFEQYDSDYVVNIQTVSQINHMVSINNALQIDFTGQITAETQFGPRLIGGQGGQPEMHIGAFLSQGGRAITLLASTVFGGVSTIVPQLEQGSLVTIPRFFADMVVTEYGTACLLGKSHRERAEELIRIAHPDHRDFLQDQARELFHP